MRLFVKFAARDFYLPLAALWLVAAIPGAGAVVADPAVKAILSERIDTAKKGVGIVVGIIDADGSRVVSYGLDKAGGKPVNGDTVFEIGSISKTFTSLLLADMVTRGEVSLDDPISKYLPAGVVAPERNGKVITLRHLATHTSGLPRMPDNVAPKDPTNPYADYDAERMLAFLTSVSMRRDPGESFEYSNYGTGLLGYLLARRAGLSYSALLRARILQPLDMRDTAIVLYPTLQVRFAQGHDAALRPVSAWEFDAMAAAGGIRSTVNDMLKYLSAQMGKKQTPLQAAMTLSQQAISDGGAPNTKIGLAWLISSRYGSPIIWHNGATGGFHSYIGFTANEGVVILSNTQNSVDDIGAHLLEARYPLGGANGAGGPAKPRTAVTLDAAILDTYAGQYQLAPDFIITFTHEGDKFYAQATRQPKFEVFAESETEFFLKAVNAQITFVKNAYGKADRMVLHQGGRDQEARRISAAEPPKPASAADRAAARRALAPTVMAKFADELEKRGYSAARSVNNDFALNPAYQLPEAAINSWGMALIPAYASDGIELLKLNAEVYPRSATAHNSLGYAYRISGDNAAAIKSYQRALELDPGLAATGRAIAVLQKKAVKLDARAFDAYTGEYELAPNFNISIRREGDKYFAQATGQGAFEIFAENDSAFFATAALIQIAFFKDAGGKVTHLVLSQNGRDTKAMKFAP